MLDGRHGDSPVEVAIVNHDPQAPIANSSDATIAHLKKLKFCILNNPPRERKRRGGGGGEVNAGRPGRQYMVRERERREGTQKNLQMVALVEASQEVVEENKGFVIPTTRTTSSRAEYAVDD